MRHCHIFRQSFTYLIPELTICVTAKKVRCWRNSLQQFSIFITPRCLSCKQQRLRPLSWRFACWMPKCVNHFYTSTAVRTVAYPIQNSIVAHSALASISLMFSPFNLRPIRRQDASLQTPADRTRRVLRYPLWRSSSRCRPHRHLVRK